MTIQRLFILRMQQIQYYEDINTTHKKGIMKII